MKPYIEKYTYWNSYDGKQETVFYVWVYEKNFFQKLFRLKPSYKIVQEYEYDEKSPKVFYSKQKAQDWINEYIKFHNLGETSSFFMPMSPTEIVHWGKIKP